MFNGEDLLTVSEQRMREIRGIDISMIFQDPMTYLNPVFTIGQQLVDVVMAHQRVKPAGEKLSPIEAKSHAIDLLRLVQLPNPDRQFDCYPHPLSGGLRQPVPVASALTRPPRTIRHNHCNERP